MSIGASLSFEEALKQVLNMYGKDVECRTPDSILCGYMLCCLDVWHKFTEQRDAYV